MKFTTPYTVDFSNRNPEPGVDGLFAQRWSPRSFKKTYLPEEVVASVIDAARWSPSAHNEQPWLFVTSTNDTEFKAFLELLIDSNQIWAKNAGVLGFMFARRNFEYNDSPNHFADFDCGAAWMAMTLQARNLDLYTHGLGGIHKDKTYEALKVPKESFEVICGFALGAIDSPELLDDELKEREVPSSRKPLGEIWKKGGF
jgi:nitroreductase